MQDHCSRMKIQAISIAFESANQAPTKPLRRWAPSAPKPLRRQRKALRREPGEPCLPDTWPIASALAPRRARHWPEGPARNGYRASRGQQTTHAASAPSQSGVTLRYVAFMHITRPQLAALHHRGGRCLVERKHALGLVASRLRLALPLPRCKFVECARTVN